MEEISVKLARMNVPVSVEEKREILLKSLPESLNVMAIIADANKMEYDEICGRIKSEIDRRKSKSK